jgi:hypothetical protein
MAEDQKHQAPWKNSVWVQQSRKPDRSNFDARLENALKEENSEEESQKEQPKQR